MFFMNCWRILGVCLRIQGGAYGLARTIGRIVFNGKEWKVYDRSNALPGDRVMDIAASPVTEEVAVATSGGVVCMMWREEHGAA